MITRQSNNILPNLHPLVTWHFGENYLFNGCMKLIMEYVEPNEIYSYSFFAGIGGDNFVQVYGHNFDRYNDCVSVVYDGAEFVKYVFDEIGYEHTYITASQIAANKGMYIDTVKAYIDKGVPVLLKGAQYNNTNYQLIVGYEEYGKVLLFLDGDSSEPFKLNTTENPLQDWIFIGKKAKETDYVRLFKNAMAHIHTLLTSPEKYDCSYGTRAFCRWADDIENGRYDSVSPEQFDSWRDYNVYICNFATNFCGISFDFLSKAKEYIPELQKVYDRYTAMNEQYKLAIDELEGLEGNFNVTLAALQDKERRVKIAHIIRRFVPLYEEFAELLQNLK